MAQNKINKLELTWIGTDEEPMAVEPRVLLDTPGICLTISSEYEKR